MCKRARESEREGERERERERERVGVGGEAEGGLERMIYICTIARASTHAHTQIPTN
jgi:hypothetical protein